MQKPSQAPSPPQHSDWTIIKLLGWATTYFSDRDIDSPRATAEILLAHALGVERIQLYLNYDKPLTREELGSFKPLLQRRARREPVAYITGEKEFWTLALSVDPNVLIPRPDTECLVENTLPLLERENSTPPKRILELGTGSGAIILALASERPYHHYYANDRSLMAVRLAKQNALRHQLDKHIHFFCADWFSASRPDNTLFDMIVSNPPYIPTTTINELQPEVNQFEPKGALDGGSDGLDCIRHIIRHGYDFLGDDGKLVLEIGYDQKDAISKFVTQFGKYGRVDFFQDYGARDRVILLSK
jgi:release factor glutamine methyltransferase